MLNGVDVDDLQHALDGVVLESAYLERMLQPDRCRRVHHPAVAATALQAAGDQMLQAVVFHSNSLEFSEQFDATTGYAKSVSNLSWGYASFLSAVRARNAI